MSKYFVFHLGRSYLQLRYERSLFCAGHAIRTLELII